MQTNTETQANTLNSFSADALRKADLPPIKWLVEDMIPCGMTLMASPPKYGKSWMVLDLGLSVANGSSFLGKTTVRTGCLYLALEDNPRRLKVRMDAVFDKDKELPYNFYFATSASTIEDGLLSELTEFMEAHPTVGMIIIDTLQKIRGASSSSNAYSNDYREIGILQKFAELWRVSLVLVHHLRKMDDDSDPFNRISGTNGILGAVDTAMVLTRESRHSDKTTLSITGRDVEQSETVIRFNKETCKWENVGSAGEEYDRSLRENYENDPVVITIKGLLKDNPHGVSKTAAELLLTMVDYAGTIGRHNAMSLGKKLVNLEPMLLRYDNIRVERNHRTYSFLYTSVKSVKSVNTSKKTS